MRRRFRNVQDYLDDSLVGPLFAEFLAVAHPDYADLEAGFVHLASFPDPSKASRLSRKRHEIAVEIWSPPEPALQRILPEIAYLEGLLDRARNGSPDEALALIEELGLPSLRPGTAEDRAAWRGLPIAESVREALSRRADLFDEIRSAIWRRLDAWYTEARQAPSRKDRESAIKRWRRVGTIMSGDLRGRGRQQVLREVDVAERYYRRLFRLVRAQVLLKAWPWDRNFAVITRQVAECVGIPVDELRKFLLLDDEGSPKHVERAPGETDDPVHRAARIHAGEPFKLTEQSVSNILARFSPAGSTGPFYLG